MARKIGHNVEIALSGATDGMLLPEGILQPFLPGSGDPLPGIFQSGYSPTQPFGSLASGAIISGQVGGTFGSYRNPVDRLKKEVEQLKILVTVLVKNCIHDTVLKGIVEIILSEYGGSIDWKALADWMEERKYNTALCAAARKQTGEI